MSYDLMVFEPNTEANDHAQFIDWYKQQTQWTETHGYNDPTVSTPNLRSWFMDIIQSFPPLNGPLSKEDLPDDEDSATDYSVGKSVVYCSFVWSKQELAYKTTFKLAQKHTVGFFDVSSGNEEVWIPVNGKLILMHSR